MGVKKQLLYNTEAVVVRNIAYGESNAVVTLLTPGGLVAAMARGAKKPQSRLAAGVQPCVQGMYTLYRRSGMGTLSQVEVVQARRALREDLQKAAYAAYFCELVLAVAEEAPNGSLGVYHSFLGALERLETIEGSPKYIARIWEAKIASMLGVSSEWTTCVSCQERPASSHYAPSQGGFLCEPCNARVRALGRSGDSLWDVPESLPKILYSFERVPWNRLGKVQLSPVTEEAVRRILMHQLRDFAGLSLKSRSFLESIDAVYDTESPEP